MKVVLTLVEHLKNKGYDLYTDQFYTSPAQADRLQKCGLTLTGTIMSNRRGLPEQFKGKHKMDIGSTESYRCGDMMALAWRDKQIIYMLSTKHSNDRKDVPSWYVYYICIFVMSFLFTLGDQQNPPKNKPNVIHQYNRYMLGVDKLDHMMCYYSFIYKSVKWWRKVFFFDLRVDSCQYVHYLSTHT